MTTRHIRALLAPWFAYRRKRRLYRAYPWLRHFDEAERLARKKHGKVEDVRAARQLAMTAALREGR